MLFECKERSWIFFPHYFHICQTHTHSNTDNSRFDHYWE